MEMKKEKKGHLRNSTKMKMETNEGNGETERWKETKV